MNRLLFVFILSLFLFSCSEELITVVDEYNSPYEIYSIPGDNKVSISFISGVLASDFAGFNIYVGTLNSFNQPDDALKNSSDLLPSISYGTHTRTNITLEISNYSFVNGQQYFITVTAYGTNELVSSKYIETKISKVVPVIPRPEGEDSGTSITVNNIQVASISGNLLTTQNGWKVQYFGVQTNFNSVVIITNIADSYFDNNAVYSLNGLYIFKNGNQLAKVWMSNENNYHWAYQGNAASWNGI